jgi:exonuclease V gamma subunit
LSAEDKQSYVVSQININELMKTINKISEQLEAILEKWYAVLLADKKLPLEFVPEVQIIDSELLSNEIKLKLAELLYSKFNCSFQTAYELLGINYEDEVQKRKDENQLKVEDIFTPRLTVYTNTGKNSNDNPSNRPADENSKSPNKQQQDMDRRGTSE